MASPVSSLFGAPASPAGTTPTTTTTGTAPNEQMFLQLLVSQIQNQDPTNPVDGTQFVSQLAQFSQLEQLIAIRGDMDSVTAANAGTTSGTTNVNAPGGTTSAGTPSTGPNGGGSNSTPGTSSTTN